MKYRIFKTLAFALLLGVCSAANGQVNLPDFDGQKNREQISRDFRGMGGDDIEGLFHKARHHRLQNGAERAGVMSPELDEMVPDMMSRDVTDSLCLGNSRKKVALKGTQVTIDNIVYDVAGDTAIVYDGRNCSGAVTIPSSITYNGHNYPVTKISNCAFQFCRSLTSVAIPNSVATIGYEAFWGCISLTSVTIPNSVTTIGGRAFYGCSSLKGFYVEGSNPNYCSLQGVLFTKDKTTLIRYPNAKGAVYEIPNSVTTIGFYAFENCSSLTTVEIPNSVTTIENYAFTNCSSLTTVEIPDNVVTIGNSVFSGCSSLTSVTLGNSVATIGYFAFYGCSSLEGFYVDGGNPNYCAVQGVLFTKDKTTLIRYPNAKGSVYEIPNSVTTIGNSAFDNSSSLTSVTIPNSVTTIDDYAFYGCSSLTSVTIPNSTDTIGFRAFDGCSSLTSVVIGNSVTTIGIGAFRGCNSLTSVTLGNSVTTIVDYAFYGCSSLTSVTIPNSVTTIGTQAFKGCSSLASVTIGNNVTTIGDYAFDGCSSLEGFYVDGDNPNYCDVQGVLFTKDKTALIRYPNAKGAVYEIPNSVTTIRDSAFDHCISLTSVTIPNSVTTIENYAFFGCCSMTSVFCKIKVPIDIYKSTFYDVPFSTATLYVPIGCKKAFAAANYWKDFGTITEMDFSIKGDVNEDDVVNVSDVTSLISYLLGTETLPDFTKADLNGDFEINVSDVTALISLLLAQ